MLKPVSGWIDRSVSHQAAESVSFMAGVIDRTVDLSTHVLEWLNTPDLPEEAGVVSALTKRVAEFADGIACLVRASATSASYPALRSMFEARLSCRYILQEDSLRRSRCYRLQHYLELRNSLELIDETTARGRAFRDALLRDEEMGEFEVPEYDASAICEKINETLTGEPFAEIMAEWEGQPRRYPNWFSLFGGPATIRELADCVGVPAQYLVLYGDWSQSTHVKDTLRTFHRSVEAEGRLLRPIRYPHDSQSVALLAVGLLFGLLSRVVEAQVPAHRVHFVYMYVTEIRSDYLRLAGPSLLRVD